jgi:hypothetical protein
MGKRSDFERKPRDYYITPIEAVEPLVEHLPKIFDFAEPCAGDGTLVNHIENLIEGAVCTWASDIEPQNKRVLKNDYSQLTSCELEESEYIITNPPWDRKMLHPMIEHFAKQKPTWLLFDADWMHTKQSVDYVQYLHKIVSVGRIKWFGNMTGKDNCAWYLFDYNSTRNAPLFYGRKK